MLNSGPQILVDVSGWYVTFNSDSGARRAQKVMENRKLQHYAVNLDVRKPPITHSTPLLPSYAPRSTFDAAPKDPVIQAREMILTELKALLRKDMRERLIPARIVQHIEEVRAKKRAASISPAKPKADAKSVPTDKPIAPLKFTKKPGAITKKRTIQEVVEDEAPPEPAPASEADPFDSRATSPTPEVERPAKKARRAKIVPEVEVESEDDKAVQVPPEEQFQREKYKRPAEDTIEPPKRGRKKRKVKIEEPTIESVVDEPTIIFTPEVDMLPTVDIPVSDVTEKVEDEPQPILVETKPIKSRGRPRKPPAPKVPMRKPPPPDPFEVGLTDPLDDEDVWFLYQGLSQRKRSKPVIPEVSIEEERAAKKRHPAIRQHITGSARTEGYYKIPDAVKSLYVASRNRAAVAVDESNKVTSSKTAVGASSRSTRVDSRKLARGMEQANKYLNLSADAQEQSSLKLKFNQLKTRKKQLKFSRSPIHDWGLYAMEPISQGEMVIEYVGELIRQQVADKREKYYERMGIGSSYLFRVDDDAVVDATKKGNLGLVRFLLVITICY